MARLSDAPIILQKDWSRATRRALSRDAIGENAAWAIRDYIPNLLGAPLEKRGGFAWQGGVFPSAPGTVKALTFAPFTTGDELLAVDSGAKVYRSSSPFSSWTTEGSTVPAPKQNPLFFQNAVVFPSNDGTTALSTSSNTTVSSYTECGVTHKPIYLCSWRSRMVGGSSRFVVFGPPIGASGSLTGVTWDNNATYGVDQELTGIAEVRGIILLFFAGKVKRIRGTIPAGYGVTTQADILIEDFIPGVGCVDAFSITPWNEDVIWADRKGVYLTDGSAPVDLTKDGGIKKYFTDTMSAYTSSWRVSAGTLGDLLILTIWDGAAEVKTFACYLPARIWWEFTNFRFWCLAGNAKGLSETYAGSSFTAGRVAALSGIMLPVDGNKQDADAVDVLPYLELGYPRFGAGPQRLTELFTGYELKDPSAGSPPTLTVNWSVDPDPLLSSWSSYGDGTETFGAKDIHGTSDQGYHFHRTSVRTEGAGITIRVQQTNASAHTRLYSFSAALVPLGGMRGV